MMVKMQGGSPLKSNAVPLCCMHPKQTQQLDPSAGSLHISVEQDLSGKNSKKISINGSILGDTISSLCGMYLQVRKF